MWVNLVKSDVKYKDNDFTVWVVLLRVNRSVRSEKHPLYYSTWTSKLSSVEGDYLNSHPLFFSSKKEARQHGLMTSLRKANDRYWELLKTPIKFIKHEL